MTDTKTTTVYYWAANHDPLTEEVPYDLHIPLHEVLTLFYFPEMYIQYVVVNKHKIYLRFDNDSESERLPFYQNYHDPDSVDTEYWVSYLNQSDKVDKIRYTQAKLFKDDLIYVKLIDTEYYQSIIDDINKIKEKYGNN